MAAISKLMPPPHRQAITEWSPFQLGDMTAADGLAADGFGAAIGELVGEAYTGAYEPKPWAGMLRCLLVHCSASWAALIFTSRSRSPHAVVARDSPQGVEVYGQSCDEAELLALDPFVGLPPGGVATLDEVCDARLWMAGDGYRNHVGPRRIRYILGANIVTAKGQTCHLRVMRPPGASDFSPMHKQLCGLLLPHLERALGMAMRNASAETKGYLQRMAVEPLDIGMLALDRDGVIVHCNEVADSLLASEIGLHALNGRLRAVRLSEDKALQQLFTRCRLSDPGVAEGTAGAITLTGRAGQAALGVLVRSLPASTVADCGFGTDVRVAVFLRDARRKAVPEAQLVAALLELTSAEAAVAAQLAGGKRLEEAAAELGIRPTTARAHLRAIFQKTGVTRQAELVHRVLASVLVVG